MTVFSIVVPVYKNEEGIEQLIYRMCELEELFKDNDVTIEFVIVVDASPDNSYNQIVLRLSDSRLIFKIFLLDKNVGSGMAIRFGMKQATGSYAAVMSADLQEPASLFLRMYAALTETDSAIILATRESRDDGTLNNLLSSIYWVFWSKLMRNDIPHGGVDVFAINRRVINQLNANHEVSTALIAMILDMGSARLFVSYSREPRSIGKSSWTFRKKMKLMGDSIYGHTDFPIRILNFLGLFGSLISLFLGLGTLGAKLFWGIAVPGYTSLILAISISTSLLLLGIGILGNYIWRIFLNTSSRAPSSVLEIAESRSDD